MKIKSLPIFRKKEGKARQKFSIIMLILGILLALYSISLLMPLFWGLLTSFKDNLQFNLDRLGFPSPWQFSNYVKVFQNFYVDIYRNDAPDVVYMPELILNSVLYTVGSTLVQTTVMYVTAYAAARFNFRIGKIIYTLVILSMIVPVVGSEPSALAIAETLHLKDSIPGMYLMKAYFIGMYFLVFYENLKVFPKDYDEAAYIDGASNLNVMLRVIFPMTLPTYFTIALLLFVQFWNDYTTPMLFMPNVPTLSYGVYYFANTSKGDLSNTPMRIGACVIMLIPTLLLFLFFHRRLLSNVTIGGVKE